MDYLSNDRKYFTVEGAMRYIPGFNLIEQDFSCSRPLFYCCLRQLDFVERISQGKYKLKSLQNKKLESLIYKIGVQESLPCYKHLRYEFAYYRRIEKIWRQIEEINKEDGPIKITLCDIEKKKIVIRPGQRKRMSFALVPNLSIRTITRYGPKDDDH
jgi:hypothetical protein